MFPYANRKEIAWRGIPFHIFGRADFNLQMGMGGKKENLFHILEMDVGGKCHFADRENASGMISLHGLVFAGHSIPR